MRQTGGTYELLLYRDSMSSTSDTDVGSTSKGNGGLTTSPSVTVVLRHCPENAGNPNVE